MAFLRNDAINRVNLHSGIQAVAQGAGGIFFVVFLLQAGVPVSVTLAAQAAIFAGRFAMRPAILPLAKRFGLKPLFIIGTIGLAVQYPILAEVDGVDWWLLALCVVASVADVFYWVTYNAYFAAVGDAEHRGHQIGAREAIVAVVGIVAPLLGAWALLTVGARGTFAAVGIVQVLAVLPLLGAPNVAVRRDAPGAFRAARLGALLILTDGWFDASYVFVWQIALFVSLGHSISAYGGAMALAGLVGAICGLMVGRFVDAGHGRRAAVVAYSVAALILILRAVTFGSPWLAVIANALSALAMPLLLPVLGKPTYNLAKASPCPFRFILAAEAGWDIGGSFGCLFAAGLVAAGAPLSVPILLGLLGVGGGLAILWRYYDGVAA